VSDREAVLQALIERHDVMRLFSALHGHGEELRIIGGAPRNALLGLPVNDIDCAITCQPEETMRRAHKAGFKTVPTGIAHGTVSVIIDGVPFEVTTLRTDLDHDGRRARVAFGRDFVQDALRRDFTINALSIDAEGRLHDVTGGLADLKARRIRFIGDAHQRIREDYLRILRFFRFHAAYGHGAPDAEGLHACIAERAGLASLSRERIRMEMLKLLANPQAYETLVVMADCGLLGLILGGVPSTARLARVIGQGDTMQALGALGVAIIEDALRLADLWRLSNAEADRLKAMALAREALGCVPQAFDAKGARRFVYRHGNRAVLDALIGEDAGLLRQAALDWPCPSLPWSGRDLLKHGHPPGPDIGERLRIAERAWIEADFPSDEAKLARLLDLACGTDARVK
jgi:poly(A) polymerase